MKCGSWGVKHERCLSNSTLAQKLVFLEAVDDLEIFQPLSGNGPENGYVNH